MSAASDTPLRVRSFHAVLLCRKWAECVSFYTEALGFPVVDRKEGFVEVAVAPGSRIGLLAVRHGLPTGSPAPAGPCPAPPAAAAGDRSEADVTPGGLILSWRVPDVEEAHRTLEARCPSVGRVRRHPWGARLFELKDPEGRRLEFWCPEELPGKFLDEDPEPER